MECICASTLAGYSVNSASYGHVLSASQYRFACALSFPGWPPRESSACLGSRTMWNSSDAFGVATGNALYSYVATCYEPTGAIVSGAADNASTVLQLVATELVKGSSLLYMHSLQGRPLHPSQHMAPSRCRLHARVAVKERLSTLTQSPAFQLGRDSWRLDTGNSCQYSFQHSLRNAGAPLWRMRWQSNCFLLGGNMLYLAVTHHDTPAKDQLATSCTWSLLLALPCLLGLFAKEIFWYRHPLAA